MTAASTGATTGATAAAAATSRPTVLFIHGMWGGGHQWADWQAFFGERGFDTRAPTLRHHDVDPAGAPPEALGKVSLLDYAADLEAEIDALPDKPILVGHSMGALIAQILAARGRCKAAVFLTPAPPAGWPAVVELAMPSVTRTLLGKTFGPGLTGRPHRLSFKQAAYSCLNNMPEDRQREEYSRWVWESGRVLFEIAFWYLDWRRRAARVNPANMTVPTLTVSCGRDRITPRPVVRRIAERYRPAGGDYKTYDRHGHFLIREAGWEQVAADCLAWIEKATSVKAAA
ncbi:MAG: alpha/beta hydrolase [Bauldia litoralis]